MTITSQRESAGRGWTPGPWEFRADHPQNACGHVYSGSGQEIATCYGGVVDHAERSADGIWPEQPVRDANARLIAAAPALAEACASVWLMLADTSDNELRLIADECRAALSRATGEVQHG